MAKIRQSKREFRERLRALPVEEKLALLDALRERALTIRAARRSPEPGALREEPAAHECGSLTEENEENEED